MTQQDPRLRLVPCVERHAVEKCFAASRDAVVHTDVERRVLWCNAAFEAMTGYTLAELSGLTMAHLYARPEDYPIVRDTMRSAVLECGEDRYPMTYLRKNGIELETETSSWPVLDGRGLPTGHVKILTDITAQNRLERARAKLLRLAIDQSLPSGERIDALLSLACDFLGMPIGTISLVRDETLTVLCAKSTLSPIRPGAQYPIADTDCRMTLTGNAAYENLNIDAPRSHPLMPEIALRTYVGAPLFGGDERIGTVSFLSPLARPAFGQDELDMLALVAGFVGQHLANEKRLQALERAATQDWLTGACSSRRFRSDLDVVFKTVRRNASVASLVLFDIDHFKSVNDQYGHDMGDRVLADVARRAQAIIGPNRKLYRVGGEEFAVILPGTCGESATILAEQLRQKLADTKATPAGLPHLTASFGVAELDSDLSVTDAWLKCADIALYAAKNSGRNRVSNNRSHTAMPLLDPTKSVTGTPKTVGHGEELTQVKATATAPR